MLNGLCAFPLTPMVRDRPDVDAVALLVARAAKEGVDSLGVLGSTGNYAYLSREERSAVLEAAVGAASGVSVVAGVGAVRLRDVMAHVEDAQLAGVAALLLAPVSYQRLTEPEVYGLYRDVASQASVPVIVYDNPATTGFSFSDDLYARIADLPQITSIKIPPPSPTVASARLQQLRSVLPERLSIGVSGDWMAAEALLAGFDVWYSVIAGVLPAHCRTLVDHALAGRDDLAWQASAALDPVWELFRTYGSLRVTAALAEDLGLIQPSSLPLPLQGLDAEGRAKVAEVIQACGLQE